MTRLGEYLYSKSINQSEIARKTGYSRARINQLCNNEKTRLEAKELYKIFLAIGVNPGEEFNKLYFDVKLSPDTSKKSDSTKNTEGESLA
ncbi:Cro/C1-type HTH DNA-binding domain-containing protein [Arachidicoccus rhizosphaerae]|uniref:Cro/C1-type HTH DNA-binding domain-containing protein n=1 Tax=Arachidicoccus rhizosphaerae TaxID=551991 RepID=A0A1H4AJP0_9BACT|nr:helix-turn-helix transcriptional regulator [Arachidicoccus rhizosphaerae]SEA35988.1 Cro/C1-type HTH DNA-binding domain-containing protein [Arachidicoccus rhizosphaerae]